MNEQTQEQKRERARAAAEACKRILIETKYNREISAGCKEQILQDIQDKKNPYRIILTAAECISRLNNSGDSFYNEVKAALFATFEKDPAEVLTAESEGAEQ